MIWLKKRKLNVLKDMVYEVNLTADKFLIILDSKYINMKLTLFIQHVQNMQSSDIVLTL